MSSGEGWRDVMKKKVCIIHKVTAPEPRSFYKQARSLVKAGYEITLIGLYNGDEAIQGIRLMGCKSPDSRFARFIITNYLIFIKALKENADVYHFHDLDFVPWALLLKLLTRSTIIYDIREAYPEYMMIKTYIPQYMRRLLYLLVYVTEHVAAKFFDAIVPNDNYIARDFKHRHNVVIFNFPTLDFFKNDEGVAWQDREYDLFYHGSLPTYHFEIMMKVAERLNSEDIENIWGIVTNDEPTVTWAAQELTRRKLQHNFVFLPYTDYLAVGDYLGMAKIGIVPLPPYKKFQKNIPLKMFEFMGSGLPVVLSDLPPSRQFIEGENCAIAVEPDNIEAYARAIKLLLSKPETAVEMGNKGKQMVFQKYNWDAEEKKLIQLYEELTLGTMPADKGAKGAGKLSVIINADDFGITKGTNTAVFELVEAGMLTSTSVMSNMPDYEEVAALKEKIGIGVHLNLTVGSPVSEVRGIPSLVDEEGRFLSLPQLLGKMREGRLSAREIESEFDAQIQRLIDIGIAPDHVDSHESLLKYPFFMRCIRSVAKKNGIMAVRTYTPRKFDYSRILSPRKLAISLYLALQKKGWRLHGFRVTHTFDSLLSFGLDYATALQKLRAMFQGIPEGILEIAVHPGYHNGDSTCLGGYVGEREVELRALLSDEFKAILMNAGVDLISFKDL